MDKINVVILEDDQIFQIKLEHMLYETEFRVMNIFADTQKIEEYLETERVDIFISDLYIGNKPDGAEIIKKVSLKKIPIVCITTCQEDKIYYKLNDYLSGYLVKPFHRITLLSTLRKAIQNQKKDQLIDFIDRKYLMITGKLGRLEKINFSDIVHLEASGNYTIIVTKTAKFAKKISMNKLLQFELDARFRRIHSKYIINSEMITSLTYKSLVLNNNDVYIISRNFKKNIKDLYKKKSTPMGCSLEIIE